MQSDLPKVLHRVANLPMVSHVLRVAADAHCEKMAVVTGNNAHLVHDVVTAENPEAEVFEQKERLGTGHAVLAAREAIARDDADILVLFGDTPLLTSGTLTAIRDGLADGASVVVLGFHASDPTGYGRLIESDGRLLAIREHREANEEERRIGFCNGGIMGLSGKTALELLDAIDNNNGKGEYYLTDVVEIANKRGFSVIAIEAPEAELMGVNTREGLAEVEALWQTNAREQIMKKGVTLQAPATVFMSADTLIGRDVVIEPNVVFGPGVEVASGARIRSFSYLEGAKVGENAEIGPFARLRPGTVLFNDTKIGNFVEAKNTILAAGAKVNHLTYVGDTEIGEKANIGAGTITCNYDGFNKHETKIGAGAFIGSNSSLVAPVTIGDGAYVGSGSVVVEDVPADGLALARGRQIIKEGKGREIRERNAMIKEQRKKGG